MKPTEHNRTDSAEWQRRKAASARLGLVIGAMAVVLFLLSIWKYRPL